MENAEFTKRLLNSLSLFFLSLIFFFSLIIFYLINVSIRIKIVDPVFNFLIF